MAIRNGVQMDRGRFPGGTTLDPFEMSQAGIQAGRIAQGNPRINIVDQAGTVPQGEAERIASEAEIERQRELAQQFAAKANSNRDIKSVWQGLAHVADSALSGWNERKADTAERERRDAMAKALSGALGDLSGTGVDDATMRQLIALNPEIGTSLLADKIKRATAGPTIEEFGDRPYRVYPDGRVEPALPDGAQSSDPFQGTKSVQGMSLNGLVKMGVIDERQAYELGAGKTITMADGSTWFLGATGLVPTGGAMPQSGQPGAPPSPAGAARQIGQPSLDKSLTPGQRATDNKFADDYVQWNASGGFADFEKQIAQLDDVVSTLQSGDNVTGPILGITSDLIGNVINPQAVATRQAVEEVVQRNLRLILGAQFTAKEGERLIDRAYNPSQPEAENLKRVTRLITQMKEAAAAKESASRYYEQNGTLKGWDGRLWRMDDFKVDDESIGAATGAAIGQGPMVIDGVTIERVQ